MKKLSTQSFTVILTLLSLCGLSYSQDQTPTTPAPTPPSAPAPAAAGDTPLGTSMDHMSKAYKGLVAALKAPVDADKDKYVALATILKDEATKARGFVPAKADGLPDDQKAALVQGYQKAMDEFSSTVDTLTQALKDGKWDEAKTALATLKTEMKAGHQAFRKKD